MLERRDAIRRNPQNDNFTREQRKENQAGTKIEETPVPPMLQLRKSLLLMIVGRKRALQVT